MDWTENIADQLPPPRDDEPAALRDDIVDELADHLRCALSRERHFTDDQTQAERNVLARFGDPRKIARQLWFDWMKEKIMSQRMTLVVGSLMAVACLVASGMAWVAVRESRQMNAAILTTLKQLAAPARVEPPPSMDWNPLKVHLVLGEKDGKPAQGFSVELKGHPIDSSTSMDLEETSGENGIADFGLVRPGRYALWVTTPWNESCLRQFVVRPGKEHVEEVVCLASAPEEADIAFDVSGWPEVLRENNLWVVCSFRQDERQHGKQFWISEKRERRVVITPSGELFDYVGGYEETRQRGISLVGFEQFEWPTKRALTWPGRRHSLTAVAVVRPPDKSKLKEGEPQWLIRMGRQYPGSARFDGLRGGGPGGGGQGGGGFGGGFGGGSGGGQPPPLPAFEAKPGELNRWTIRLSQGLLEHIRHELAQDEKQ